jgi:hypothetical protein
MPSYRIHWLKEDKVIYTTTVTAPSLPALFTKSFASMLPPAWDKDDAQYQADGLRVALIK